MGLREARLFKTVNPYLFSDFQVVSDIAHIKKGLPVMLHRGHILPIQSLCPFEGENPQILPPTIKGVKVRSISAIVVRPINA
jgi:hypothetical protein